MIKENNNAVESEELNKSRSRIDFTGNSVRFHGEGGSESYRAFIEMTAESELVQYHALMECVSADAKVGIESLGKLIMDRCESDRKSGLEYVHGSERHTEAIAVFLRNSGALRGEDEDVVYETLDQPVDMGGDLPLKVKDGLNRVIQGIIDCLVLLKSEDEAFFIDGWVRGDGLRVAWEGARNRYNAAKAELARQIEEDEVVA